MKKPVEANSFAPDAPDAVAVQLPADAPVLAVGPYLPGMVYRVAPDEAARLIAVKGFVPAEPEPPQAD